MVLHIFRWEKAGQLKAVVSILLRGNLIISVYFTLEFLRGFTKVLNSEPFTHHNVLGIVIVMLPPILNFV